LFDKNKLLEQGKRQPQVSFEGRDSSQFKAGTIIWYIKRFSEEVTPYVIESIRQYKNLFLYDPKKKAEIINDSETKDLKKFLTAFTNPFLDEIKAALKMDYLEIPYVTECLNLIY